MINRSSSKKIKNIPDLTISSRSTLNYKGYSTLDKPKLLKNQKLIFFDTLMPSIHHNEHSIISQDSGIFRIRNNISQLITSDKQKEEWNLYISKVDLIQKNIRFQEVQKFLLKLIHQLYTRLLNIKKQYKSYQNSFDQEKITFKRFKQKLCESSIVKQNNLLQKRSQIRFKQDFSKINSKLKEQESIINSLSLQNILLQKKLQLYQEKVLEKFQHTQQNRVQCRQKQQKESYQNYSLIQEKKKYQNQAELRRIQFQTLSRQYITMSKHHNQIKNQLKKANQQLIQLKLKIKRYEQLTKYRQLWLMQNQQFIQLRKQCINLKQEKVQYLKRVEHLRQKNKQLIKSIHMKTHLNPDQEQDKQQLDYIMKNFQQWLKIFILPRVYPNLLQSQRMAFGDMQNNFQETKNMQNILEDGQLNYRLIKPSFYVYFEAHQNNILSQKVFAQYRTLERQFYLKMRGVLDSMYNQFILYSHRQWVGFPQFAIGFLQKYQINKNTRLPQYRKKQVKSQENINFLIDLFNKKIANTWECQVFRCFLLEEYNLDEIFFYLDCRNQLHGGPALKCGLSCGDPVIYIKINRVLELVNNRLVKYDHTIIQKIKAMLHMRKKFKNGNYLVDGYFALKVLLEVYSIEKTKSQRIFKQSFTCRFSNKITYADYRQFMRKNFNFLSEPQICFYYRQIYFISSGKITYKAIHYICANRGLFIPLIWQNKQPSNKTQSLAQDPLLLNLLNQVNKLDIDADESGLEQIRQCQTSLSQLLTNCKWFKQNKYLFFIRFINELNKLIKLKIYTDIQANNLLLNQFTQQNIRSILNTMLKIAAESNQSLQLIRINKQKMVNSYKMVSRNFKIRMQQSFEQFQQKKIGELLKNHTQPYNQPF